MRGLLKALAFLALALWGLATFGFVQWIRERYGRGGPFPARQAGMLTTPLRRLMDPVDVTMERFGLRPGQTVLELGPGPGYFTAGASRAAGPDGRVLCLDIQPDMLDILRGRLDEASVANAELIASDATRLPLADRSVDAAYLVTVLGEIPDRVAALRELRRVLKPAGVLSFRETITDPDYVFEATLLDLCRAVGFQPFRRGRVPFGYWMSFRRS